MSAIWMTCERCGDKYLTGMVGLMPWPAHVCPDVPPDPEPNDD